MRLMRVGERPVHHIPGIGRASAEKLDLLAGVRTIGDLRGADAESISRKTGIDVETIERWKRWRGEFPKKAAPKKDRAAPSAAPIAPTGPSDISGPDYIDTDEGPIEVKPLGTWFKIGLLVFVLALLVPALFAELFAFFAIGALIVAVVAFVAFGGKVAIGSLFQR